MNVGKFSPGQVVRYTGPDTTFLKEGDYYTVKKYCTSCPCWCGFVFLEEAKSLSFHEKLFTSFVREKSPEEWL